MDGSQVTRTAPGTQKVFNKYLVYNVYMVSMDFWMKVTFFPSTPSTLNFLGSLLEGKILSFQENVEMLTDYINLKLSMSYFM